MSLITKNTIQKLLFIAQSSVKVCVSFSLKIEIYENINTKYFEILLKKTVWSHFYSFCLLDLIFNMHQGIVLNFWSLKATHIRKKLRNLTFYQLISIFTLDSCWTLTNLQILIQHEKVIFPSVSDMGWFNVIQIQRKSCMHVTL